MKYKHVLLLFVVLASLTTCVKVAELNDNASVSTCFITKTAPETVVFGEPVVGNGELVLPMEYGKYEFPVTLTLDIRTAQKIDKILGLDEDNTLTFETEETVHTIHLIAESGVPYSYTVSIEVAPLSEMAGVTSAGLLTHMPAGFILSQEPVVDVVESQVCLYALTGQTLPLKVELELELSPGASILAVEGSHVLSILLESYDTSVAFTVVAESGRKEAWAVQLTGVALVDESSQAEPGVWQRLEPSGPVELVFQTTGPEVVSVVTDPAQSRVNAELRDNGTPFPWNARLSVPLSPYVLLMGGTQEGDFQLSGWEQQDTLYLTDRISRVARSWIFSWNKWLNPENHALAFGVVDYESALHEMTLGSPIVDTLAGVIEIPFLKGNDFPLQIKEYVVTLSEHATSNLPKTLLFNNYKDEISFDIVSESGKSRLWKVKLKPWFSTAADVLSFEAVSYSSAENLVQLKDRHATINAQEQTVSLVLKAGYDFPFVIEAFTLELSPMAVLQEAYPDGIRFQTIEDVAPLTVIAESQECTEWHLVLVDERTEVTEARVLGYRIDSYSGTSQTQHNISLERDGIIDTTARTVTLVVNDWSNKLPLTANATLQVSKNATLSGNITTLQHTLLFESIDQEFHFQVTSESGTSQTAWTVKLEDRSMPRHSEANVINFITGNPSSGFVFEEKYLEQDKAAITLLVSSRPSKEAVLTIKPSLTLSEGASISKGLVQGAPLELTFGSPHTFSVVAEDETVREWQVSLVYAPQVPNSNFEEWGIVNFIYNILPSNGKGWTTGNNIQVSGTSRVQGQDGTYAAKLHTTLKVVDLGLFKFTSLAAGALMLGKFAFSMTADAVMDPPSMSAMGIAFLADSNPVGFEIEYNYTAGGQRVYTEPYKGTLGMPSFKDLKKIDGKDKASIIVELHNFTGSNWTYNHRNRVNMIAGYDLYSEGTSGWVRERYLFDGVAGREHLDMTHLVVRCSSSWEGDEYKGADGSTLLLDNFRLIYYLPGSNAVLLE